MSVSVETFADAHGVNIRLSNGVVDLVVSTSFGPRVLRYGFVGGANVLAEAWERSTPTPFGPWFPYGGHRLWVAPESMPGTYAPDDGAVECETITTLGGCFTQQVDASGMQKQLNIALEGSTSRVRISHTVTNRTCWPVRVAPWAISIVSGSATAVIPQPPYRSHEEDFRPARPLVQWPFTDLTDPRWSLGAELIRLTPDRGRSAAQKIGVGNPLEWCAVFDDDVVFIKQCSWRPDAEYPDFGCNNELFTAGDYLEVETLGPLRLLLPTDSATHLETWSLSRGGRRAGANEHDQAAMLRTLIEALKSGGQRFANASDEHR